MPLSDTQIMELRRERAKVLKNAGDLLEKARNEKRAMTAEESQKFDELHGEAERQYKDIEREERQQSADKTVEVRGGVTTPGQEDTPQSEQRGEMALKLEQRNEAFRGWMRRGMARLPEEQRKIMEDALIIEERAQGAASSTVGGYTVAPDTSMYGRIEEGQKELGFDESLCTVIETGTGADLPIPTSDDTANEGEIVGESQDLSDADAADITFGQLVLGAFLYSSRILPVSLVLLQDSSIDVEAFVGRKLGERMGRIKARHLTVGTGANQPKGCVTAATLGVTAAAQAAITYNELLDLQHSVDPAHRMRARYMFHDSTLKALKKLTDSQGRPLFLPGLAVKEPDTINSYPYTINQNMATLAASGKTVLFGDFKKYLIRKVKGFAVQRLVERLAEKGQVGFLGFSRLDADLLDAGTHPLKVLQQAA